MASPKLPRLNPRRPQICPGRSADLEETEGMSTQTEELGDLLIRHIYGN